MANDQYNFYQHICRLKPNKKDEVNMKSGDAHGRTTPIQDTKVRQAKGVFTRIKITPGKNTQSNNAYDRWMHPQHGSKV